MSEGRCVLVSRTAGVRGVSAPALVLLHGQYRDHMQLASVGEPFEAVATTYALRAPRVQTDGNNVIGYYWYYGEGLCLPEASTFGDALYQVERFVLDRDAEGDSSASRFVLIGIDQGGVLALTLAGVWPELVDAVVAIDACCPKVPAEAGLPQRALTDTPVLLVRQAVSEDLLQEAERQLVSRGANVELMTVADYSAARELRDWIGSRLGAGAVAGSPAAPSSRL